MGSIAYDFGGDVALVTGASRGLGRSIATALARAGAKVYGFDLEPPSDEGSPSDVPEPVHATLDLRDGRAVAAAVDELVRVEGRVDLVVNNAGIARDRALWNLSDDDWASVLDVDLTAAFRVLRAVAPHLRERRHGSVVQVASINGLRGRFGQANYSAAKAGLIALTRTAARELGPRGVRVNAVAPGLTETSMAAALPEEHRERARAESALGRLGDPADVAAAVLWLLSDAAAHVTGHVLVVDGGQTA